VQQVIRAPTHLTGAVFAIVAVLAAALGIAVAVGSYAGIGAVLFAAVLLWSALAWRFGVIALLLLACVDGIIKHVAPSTGTYLLKDIILVVVALGMLVWVAVDPEHHPRGRWSGAWPWMLYFGFLLSQAFAPANGVSTALAGFRAHALFALLFVIGVIYFDSARRFVGTANAVIGGIALAALAGVIQFAMGAAWLRLSSGLAAASLHYATYLPAATNLMGGSVLMYRAYGTLVDPAALGLACGVGILFSAAALARACGLGRLALLGAMLVMGLGLLFSGSRAGVMGTVVGMAALALLSLSHRSMRVVAYLGIAFVLVALPLAARVSGGAVEERLLSQQSAAYAAATRERANDIALAALPRRPFGAGLGTTGAGGIFRNAGGGPLALDNVYFAYLYETGFVGLALLVLVQASILVLTLKCALVAPELAVRATYAGMAAAQVSLLAAAFLTQGAFDYAPVAQIFWLFSGAVALPQRVSSGA